MQRYDEVGEVLAWLIGASHLMAPESVPDLADRAASRLGAASCRLYVISRDQQTLQPLLSAAHPTGEPLDLDGTVAGRAFRLSQVVPSTADGARLWVPLLDGTERLGVLDLRAHDEADLDRLHVSALRLASLLAELLVSKAQYTDTYEDARRGVPMGVAAEMLWRQLPPLTFATDGFVVTGQVEPWSEVGGDAFDYSVNGSTVHLAVLDAMGHGLSATLLASVALAAYRNARRSGHGLVDTAASVDAVLAEQFGTESFVTGVLATLDIATGELSMLCAAHPAPLLVRDGRPVGELSVEPGFPLGFGSRDDQVTSVSLQPGDRLLLFSDGVVEARSEAGEFFGLERLVDLLNREESAGHPPPETLRRLILAVLEHQQGMLQDDATLLLVEWGGEARELLAD